MKKTKLILFLFCLLWVYSAHSQTNKVTGKVLDDTDMPLMGAGVKVKGASASSTAITDIDGSFSLNINTDEAVIEISYVGYAVKEVTAKKGENITVKLQSDAFELEEMVVIGYGTVRKSDLTGAVANISSEKILERVSSNPMGALQGKVAGFNINNNSGAPGGTFKASIRGNNSINATNNPLFVIDGIIGADFSMLNSADIESVDVLKDASSTAIYGARGANGVIMVTTKKGKKGAARVNYNGSVGIGYLPSDRKIDVLNSAEYMQIEKQAWGFVPGRVIPDYGVLEPDLFNPDGTPKYDTDWQDEATRTGFNTNHALSITGGNDNIASAFSLGYDDNQGIMLNTYYKKFSGKSTNTFNIKRWLTVDASVALLHSEKNDPTEGPGGLNASRMMLEGLPIIPLRQANGAYGGNFQHAGTEGGENPVNLLENMYNIYQNTKGLGDMTVTIKILPELEFKSSISSELSWLKRNQYRGRELRAIARDQQGWAQVGAERVIYLQNENYMTFNKTINKIHRINAMLGASWNRRDMENVYATAERFSDDFYLFNNLGVAANPRPGTSGWDGWTMNSYFARVNYTLNDRYLFTVSTRIDGSSKFGPNKKYATFPSAAVAWRISNEDFMKSVSFISNLKLRASYGATGNSDITSFQYVPATGNDYIGIFDGNRYPGVGLGRIANNDLKWEHTRQFDAGIDLGLFKNRLNVTFDYYYKRTSDLLLMTPITAIIGNPEIMRNIGNMENRGFELTVNGTIIRNNDFTWNATLLLASNKNKILKLGDRNEDIFMGPYFLDATNILRVGESVNSYYGYVRTGTWGTAEAAEAAKYGRKPGDLKFKDINGDKVIDANDREIIGNGMPKLDGNFSTTFAYKNFDFTLDVSFRSGNDVMRLDYVTLEDRQTLSNSFKSVLGAWRPDNQNTSIASVRVDSKGDGSELKLSNHFIEDGSFVRGSNLVLGYSLPASILNKIKFDKVRFYVNAQNFFLITKYKGYDPETTNYGDSFAQGVEFMNYPKASSINFGVNVAF